MQCRRLDRGGAGGGRNVDLPERRHGLDHLPEEQCGAHLDTLSICMQRMISICVVVATAFLTYHYETQTPPIFGDQSTTIEPAMSQSKRHFTAQRGFFSHDSDPESWEFRAKTLPSLGLLGRLYPTDDASTQSEPHEKLAHTQWSRFKHYIEVLNKDDSLKKQYKLFYIVRHGQGLHNVKEKEVGREEWNVR
jgi:hypothetical protein